MIPTLIRLNKFISENSKYSRRKADELISQGKVFINGEKASLGKKVDPDKDQVKIQGQLIKNTNKKIYLALNKPQGFITSRSDEKDRPTVMDLLPRIPNLKPAGRLDFSSEGLLLVSNDGEFINKYTHPKFECTKEYKVKIIGELSDENKKKLEKGVIIDGKKTSKARIKILRKTEKQTSLLIQIHEGRNRQIRKMFGLVGHDVKYLQRIKIGKITLSKLAKGKFRKLTLKEINDN